MGTYTLYPNSLDNTTSIPLTTDLVSLVKAEAVNRIREAVIAIQAELGANPSGTFATVRDRLDAIGSGSGGGGVGNGSITVQLNGAVVSSNVLTLDFAGAVSAVVESPTKIKVTVGTSGQIQETLAVSNGQTTFTLSMVPVQAKAVEMYLNGLKQTYGTDYTATGQTVNYTGSISLISSDTVEFWYINDLSGISPVSYGTTLFKEYPVVSDAQTSFTMAHLPFQASAVEMYVNGIKQAYTSDYTVSGLTLSYAGLTLSSTDVVEIVYFTDANLVPAASSSLYNITTIKTGTYTAVINDFVRCDPTSGGFSVNLPTASGVTMQSIIVKNVSNSTNVITVHANGSETIDGSATATLSVGYESLTLYSDGTNWMVG